MNPWDVLTPVGTTLSAIAGMYAVFVRPIRRERKIAWVAELERQRIRDEALDGLPEQPGMTGAVPPLVIRVAALEPAMNAVAAGQKLLERRMDEANGTTKRIETVVNDLSGMVKEIVATELTTKTAKILAADSLATVTHSQHEEILAGQSANREDILTAIHDTP